MIDGWFVVRSFLTENPKFSAHIFALPLDANVPRTVVSRARLGRCGVVFHSKVRGVFSFYLAPDERAV